MLAVSPLFHARPPIVDALSLLPGRISTQTDPHAYDRIPVSDALARGLEGLKLERATIHAHRHGRGEERRLYTDHYPVIATFAVQH